MQDITTTIEWKSTHDARGMSIVDLSKDMQVTDLFKKSPDFSCSTRQHAPGALFTVKIELSGLSLS